VQTRARRRVDLAVLGVGGLVVGAAAAIGAFAGNPEHVASMWAGATLRPDGSAAITEVIDYDFGSALGKHGIYRDVPDLDAASAIKVTSPDAPAELTILGGPTDPRTGLPETRLRIGDPSETVSGRHRYLIDYELTTIQPNGMLAWNGVGTSWTVPIKQTTIEVAAPWELTDVRCVRGAAGSTEPCPSVTQPQPGHLVADGGSLDPGEGVTIFAAKGNPLPAAPELSPPTGPLAGGGGTGLVVPAVLGFLAALAGALPASRAVRRKGRERVGAGGAADAAYGTGSTGERLVDSTELDAMATIEFAPPGELTPSQAGVLLAETVRPEHKVAWLVSEAINGSIAIDQEDRRHVGLRRLAFGDPAAAPILDQIFDGESEIELGRYNPAFAKGWNALGHDLQTWMRTSGLWDPAGDRRRITVRLAGIAIAVVGLAVAVLSAFLGATHGGAFLVGVVLGALAAGAGLAMAVRAWELRVRTPLGSALWLRAESFRRFLAASEAYHAEQAAARGVLREYTAWAVAVGEVDRWTRAMSGAANIPQPVAQSALTYAYLYPALLSSTTAASTPPSSSGGGGGFGGGVGGGGGGGGGGSW
jgi:Predicted membrane protein (DUF2207)